MEVHFLLETFDDGLAKLLPEEASAVHDESTGGHGVFEIWPYSCGLRVKVRYSRGGSTVRYTRYLDSRAATGYPSIHP